MTIEIAVLGVLWTGLVIALLFFFKGAQMGDDENGD